MSVDSYNEYVVENGSKEINIYHCQGLEGYVQGCNGADGGECLMLTMVSNYSLKFQYICRSVATTHGCK